MGYDTSFKLKAPIDKRFVGWMRDVKSGDIEEAKNVLIAVCMKSQVREPDEMEFRKAYKRIDFSLRLYINYLIEDWKNKHKGDVGTEFSFCGWEYSRGREIHIDDEYDPAAEIRNDFCSYLFFSAIEATKGKFESDNDDYHSKYEAISDAVNEIEDVVWDTMNKYFISFYRQHPELADEEGDDTPDPTEDSTEEFSEVDTPRPVFPEADNN